MKGGKEGSSNIVGFLLSNHNMQMERYFRNGIKKFVSVSSNSFALCMIAQGSRCTTILFIICAWCLVNYFLFPGYENRM